VFAACSELEVEESDPLFFAGHGQSRLATGNLCRPVSRRGLPRVRSPAPEETEFGVWGGTTSGSVGTCAGGLDEMPMAAFGSISAPL
jgi:hypothetical protein